MNVNHSRMFSYLLLVGVLFLSSLIQIVEMSSKIEEIFKEHEIIPDVIDFTPNEMVKITYKSGVTVNGGNELAPTQVKEQPKIEWSAEPESFYTLMMIDPDAPNRMEPKFRNVGHWLVVNIPAGNVDDGDHLYAFVGSGPPKGSGLHRYVFLIYKQANGKLDMNSAPRVSNTSRNHRLNFNNRDWAIKHNLKLIAGNFYKAQYDDYVPILHAQLSSGTE